MIRVTYLIYVHNNADNIPYLFESLRKIEGKYSSEYIVVDDGSIDQSLEVIKANIVGLRKVTLLAHEQIGSTLAINQALDLVHGEYVHFVMGCSRITPNATEDLVSACKHFKTGIAVGVAQKAGDNGRYFGANKLIQNPITAILGNNPKESRMIGLSNSLVHISALKKCGTINELAYLHNVLLSLELARDNKFALTEKIVAIDYDQIDRKHGYCNVHNAVSSIYAFMRRHKDICENYKPELIYALYLELKSKPLKRIELLFKYLLAKYLVTYSVDDIIKMYEQGLRSL